MSGAIFSDPENLIEALHRLERWPADIDTDNNLACWTTQ